MARNFVFPDPNDRSPNAPSCIVSSPQVIGIYNQENPLDQMERVTQKVQEWFIQRAKEVYKWDDAHFSGNQCLLMMQLERRPVP